MKRVIQERILPRSVMKAFAKLLPAVEPTPIGKKIIPVCAPDISGNETKYTVRAIRSSWISSSGDYVDQFERQFAKIITQTKYAVATNSGTSALHTALVACGIGAGDEIIVPDFTMIATVNAIAYCGARPVFIDADPQSWNIDVSQIEKKIGKKTKAILVVHIYGLPADMRPILSLAKKYNLWVIEDAAEAHGAQYQGKKVGSIGDIGAFSLYANKIITTGEGGMITTNNKILAERARGLVDCAFSKERHFWHKMIGFGYRMTNLQAAVGVAQTERFKYFFKKKQKIDGWYKKYLKNIPGITFQVTPNDRTHSHWMNGLLIDEKKFGIGRNQLRINLAGRGIETRTFFIPMHMQPVYYSKYRKDSFPVSERLCRDGLYLPSSTKLLEEEVKFISQKVAASSSI